MTTADINEDCCGEDAATNKPAKREHEWVWCCDMCDVSYYTAECVTLHGQKRTVTSAAREN